VPGSWLHTGLAFAAPAWFLVAIFYLLLAGSGVFQQSHFPYSIH
jgi:hypothetical protein